MFSQKKIQVTFSIFEQIDWGFHCNLSMIENATSKLLIVRGTNLSAEDILQQKLGSGKWLKRKVRMRMEGPAQAAVV